MLLVCHIFTMYRQLLISIVFLWYCTTMHAFFSRQQQLIAGMTAVGSLSSVVPAQAQVLQWAHS